MKAIERHLYLRNGIFYYRSALPRRLHDILDLKEIVISLDTQDRPQARLQVAKLDYQSLGLLSALEAGLMDAGSDQEAESCITQFLDGYDKLKNAVGYRKLRKIKKPERHSYWDIVEKYLTDCSEDAYYTRMQKESMFQLFKELIGNPAFQKIGVEEARQFKACLLKIPANAKKILKIDSFEGVDLDKIKAGKPQSPRTINKNLSCMIALFNWAIRAEYYKGNNPFSNLTVKDKKDKRFRRHPFNGQEIKTLFQSPIYTGCRGEEWGKRFIKGNRLIQDGLYWIPLIGLYSGMRLNEICQLHLSDIRKEDGVLIFDINDSSDKSLKTSSSRRTVPVHQELIQRGLLEYLSEIADKKEIRAFPDLTRGKNTSYANVFSKRFRRLLVALEIKKEGLCFHSLRHSFADGLRNAGVERPIAMALMGHQSAKEVHDCYGYGYNLRVYPVSTYWTEGRALLR